MNKEPDEPTKDTKLRTQVEMLLRATRQDIAAMPVKDVQQLVHELQVQQIQLEMQNEELRRTQVELEGARDRYVELYDGAPTGYLTVNSRGQILEANLPACTLLGVTRQHLIGTPLIAYISDGDQAEYIRHIRALLRSLNRQSCDLDLIRPDGAALSVRFESVAIHNPPGEETLVRTALIDITMHKQLEVQFRQVQKIEAVGRLAAGVAHDFNNLLTVINGYSQLLIDQLAPEDHRYALVAETLQAGERAAELTKQLLAFSRKQIFIPQPLNLNDSLRAISSMLRRLLDDRIVLTMDLAPDLWPIYGDRGQLDQVTMNLVVNAHDAMPHGGTVTITTRNVSVTPERPDPYGVMPQNDYVNVSVRDNGQGMSLDTLSHLYEPFFTTKEVGHGTGLGLSTVYGIIKQSHGYIFVESKLGHGSTFDCYYPRMMAAQVQAPATALPDSRRLTGSETLLLVEDHASVRALVAQALTGYGYRVIEAVDGEDALRVVATLSEPIQALVTDVMMPNLSGSELAERLRHTWPGLRVLFMSGYTDPLKPALLDRPDTAFIQKPFGLDILASRLRDLLDLSI
ncbi:MAG: ATP-binding protein [Nitrospirota bacterium]|nr:ATP-binding protein [Nitrospirota bacterium]